MAQVNLSTNRLTDIENKRGYIPFYIVHISSFEGNAVYLFIFNLLYVTFGNLILIIQTHITDEKYSVMAK